MTPEYLPLADPLSSPWLVAVVAGAVISAGLVFWIAQRIKPDFIGNSFGAVFVLALTMMLGTVTFSWIFEAAQDKSLAANLQTKYDVESVTLGESDDARKATVTLPGGETASYAVTYDEETGEPFLDAGPPVPMPDSLERQ